MAFYVLRHHPTGLYLSMHNAEWVSTLEQATVFTLRSAAQTAIRKAWRDSCVVERIEHLPDRIPRGAVLPRRRKPAMWRAT